MSLHKMVLDNGPTERMPGLIFVGVSRVRTLKGLMLVRADAEALRKE